MSAKFALQLAILCTLWLSASGVEAAGKHLRWRTSHGPVHVWVPDGYDRDTAGVVIYVHGYFTDVDHAWQEHRLADQFEASHLNGLFIACEAPDRPGAAVRWENVAELLHSVAAHLPRELPAGRTIVIGHSGAHRTIASWLDDGELDTIVLVDALYGDVDTMEAWLDADSNRRLINIAALTRPWSEELAAALPDAVVLDSLPRPGAGTMRAARDARVIYVRSDEDHMQLVTGGVAIPLLLRALQLPIIDTEQARDAV